MSCHWTGFRTFLNGSPGIMFRLLERWNMIGNGQSAFRPQSGQCNQAVARQSG
jgi:hypothetical protein